MKLVKKASGKTTVKMSKAEWTDLGKKAGWFEWDEEKNESPTCPKCDGEMESCDPFGEIGRGNHNWKCQNEECDGYINNEPYNAFDHREKDGEK